MVFTSNSKKRKKPSIGRKLNKNSVTYTQYKASSHDTDLANLLPSAPVDTVHPPALEDPSEEPVRRDVVHEESVLQATFKNPPTNA
jgi:hypothetical protein